MIDQAAALVRKSRHVVAFSGAGLSVESGIPPYRGPGGLWTKHGEPPLLSYRQFAEDPKGWWESRLSAETEPGNPVYEMKLAVDRAAPNLGHLALVDLERGGLLRCVITQNVDNLHLEAGSHELLEIHGNRTRLRCLQCGKRRPRDGFPLAELPPRCPECGGVLKMDTGDVRGTHTTRRAASLLGRSPRLRLHVADWRIGHGQPGGPNARCCPSARPRLLSR